MSDGPLPAPATRGSWLRSLTDLAEASRLFWSLSYDSGRPKRSELKKLVALLRNCNLSRRNLSSALISEELLQELDGLIVQHVTKPGAAEAGRQRESINFTELLEPVGRTQPKHERST